MKPTDGIVERSRVFRDGCRYPGVGQLEQQRPASAKERRLAINPPDH